ncbi:hypothetical protein KBY97_06115 [Synechococcus sp. ATX 2A4]|uniref:hypothetical protein n=1 Tax=Synechococcus sp. ATX 2A4 TaxID=2823727 RepID=UPI0020CC696F|nr:hypothetical protein [Synechococcus sp. ATX 2A4]MCP9884700.1 hypothetical protein [Synechococcus sp. ATX 2A4]
MKGLRSSLGLGLLLGASTIFLGGEAKANEFIYAAGRDGNIYEVNLQLPRSFSFVTSTGFTGVTGTGVANGLAVDRVRNSLFYFDPNGNLQVLRRDQPIEQVATATQLSLTAQPQNAAFYNGDLWFFTRTSNVLNRIGFTYSGNTPVFNPADSEQFTLSSVPNDQTVGNVNSNSFGDIAITSDGLLFAATSYANPALGTGINDGRFFQLNLTILNETAINASYTPLDASLGIGNLQIAFNPNYDVLYGNGNPGNWVTIDVTNGNTADLSPTFTTVSPGGSLPNAAGFADLSDSATTVSIPAPLPVLGATVAFGWSRKLRKRINSSLRSE